MKQLLQLKALVQRFWPSQGDNDQKTNKKPLRSIASLLGSALVGGFLLSGASQAPAIAQAYQWKSVQIHGGGFVTGVIYSPTQKDLVYSRTDVGGAYRWDATNKVWIPLSAAIAAGSDYGVVSLATDPSNPNRVYMATGLYTQSWAGVGAVYASTDKGANWTRTALSIKLGGNESGRSAGERLQVDPNLGSTLFLGSSTDGLWKSTNYGASWSKVTSFPVSTSPIGSGGISFVLFDKSSSAAGTATKTIYVGVLRIGTTNLYKSTDGGATWAAVPGQPTNLMAHQAVRASNGSIYLAYCDGPGPNGITAGAVWKLNPSTNAWTNVSPPAGQGGYSSISVDAQNPNHLVIGTMDRWWPRDEVLRSTDGGATWTSLLGTSTWDHSLAPYAASSKPHWIGDIEIDPFNANNAWFVTGYGVYNSNNFTASPTKWIFQNKGLEETVPLELISPPSGAPLLSSLGDIDGYKHDNLDVSPAAGRLSPQYGTSPSMDFAQNLASFMVRTYNNVSGNFGSYSTNGGTSWTAFATAPAGTTYGGQIAVSADGNRIVWAPEGATALYYSTNRGSSWTASTGVPAGLKPISDRVNLQKFYAYDGENGRVWVSTNGGVSFTAQATLPTVFGWETWQATIRTAFGVEGDLWLTNTSGLYRSTNSGTSFTKIANVQSSTDVSFGKAAAGKTYPSVYIVGYVNSTYGIYRSDDAGATWVRINDANHQFGSINTIAGDPRVYGRLYIGTGGRGILYGQPQVTTPPIVSGATYRVTARHSGQVMDVAGKSLTNGAQINQWASNGGTNQQWVITSVTGGYYTFKAVHSGKNLDILGGSTADTAKVQQWSPGTGTNQQFQLVDVGGGYFQMKARHSGKCLNVLSDSRFQQVACNTATNQQFKFDLVSAARSSFEDESAAESVSAFPNPSSSSFQIHSKTSFTYEIFDQMGNTVESGEGEDGDSIGSPLRPGLYVIRIHVGNLNKAIKVIKQ